MRAIFFIDGFNLYHEINKRGWHKHKWLDLRALSTRLLRSDHTLSQVLYFTSYCTWDSAKEGRHRNYVSALTKKGVQTILGKFIPVTEEFVKGRNRISYVVPCATHIDAIPDLIEYSTYEEKRTDVNLSVKLMHLAVKDAYDYAYVVTGDGDIAAAIDAVKEEYPMKKFVAVLPFKSKEKAKDIVKACDELIELTEADIQKCQLEETVIIDSAKSINRPTSWH